jgi:hypothetical protein
VPVQGGSRSAPSRTCAAAFLPRHWEMQEMWPPRSPLRDRDSRAGFTSQKNAACRRSYVPTERDEQEPSRKTHLLCKPQPRERDDGVSTADVRDDARLERRHRRQVYPMVFPLGDRALRAEVPLLPRDLAVRLATVRRPTQNVSLCALSRGLVVLRLIRFSRCGDVKSTRIACFRGCRGAPALAVPGKQRCARFG